MQLVLLSLSLDVDALLPFGLVFSWCTDREQRVLDALEKPEFSYLNKLYSSNEVTQHQLWLIDAVVMVLVSRPPHLRTNKRPPADRPDGRGKAFKLGDDESDDDEDNDKSDGAEYSRANDSDDDDDQPSSTKSARPGKASASSALRMQIATIKSTLTIFLKSIATLRMISSFRGAGGT